MKKLLFLLVLTCCLTAGAQKKVIDSKTTYAKEVLQPYVDRGELPGAISIFYNNGVQETCCIGYANVEQKRPIKLDNVFMQCSQTKGFCGVTIAKLVEEGIKEAKPAEEVQAQKPAEEVPAQKPAEEVPAQEPAAVGITGSADLDGIEDDSFEERLAAFYQEYEFDYSSYTSPQDDEYEELLAQDWAESEDERLVCRDK